MVYCSKCGTENDDDAVECKNCGASLRLPPHRVYRRRFEDNLCFGTRRRVPIWGITFGVFIILIGLISLFEGVYPWASWDNLWPTVAIAFGLLIIINILLKR